MELERKSGCLVCGAELRYFDAPREVACSGCGAVEQADATCEAGHFVCDVCHSGSANAWIERLCTAEPGADPLQLALELMRSPLVKMHGPEHHFLVPAVLIAAWHNVGAAAASPLPAGAASAGPPTTGPGGGGPRAAGDATARAPASKSDQIRKARRRAEMVPGGFCGTHGVCGAAIGVGIFVSVITGSTPLAQQEWRLSNEATAGALQAIAELDGPRCCKRDTFLAILAARDFVRENFGALLPVAEPILCEFRELNRECLGDDCPFCP